jgi:hypothetical protein
MMAAAQHQQLVVGPSGPGTQPAPASARDTAGLINEGQRINPASFTPAELQELLDGLPAAIRRDIKLVLLPMSSSRENALMVNAIQRASASKTILVRVSRPLPVTAATTTTAAANDAGVMDGLLDSDKTERAQLASAAAPAITVVVVDRSPGAPMRHQNTDDEVGLVVSGQIVRLHGGELLGHGLSLGARDDLRKRLLSRRARLRRRARAVQRCMPAWRRGRRRAAAHRYGFARRQRHHLDGRRAGCARR